RNQGGPQKFGSKLSTQISEAVFFPLTDVIRSKRSQDFCRQFTRDAAAASENW
ncbi:8462_t:CDS:1, partial [Dentiscutata erythropus]